MTSHSQQQHARPTVLSAPHKLDEYDESPGRQQKIRRVSPQSSMNVNSPSSTSNSCADDDTGDADDADADAFVAARSNATRKAPLPAAHEIKHLRHEAVALEREFRRLCTKWKAALPDERVMLRACEAAKEKTITMHVERINAELKRQLLQQQLFFSSLQTNLSDSPLWSANQTCLGIFHDLHHELRLPDADDATRTAALRERFEFARRNALTTMDKYTRDMIHSTTPAIPYSQTGTTGTEKFTFLSNVFVCKIPNATLNDVFAATVDHYTNLPQQLERHVAMPLTSTPLCSLGKTLHYSQLEYGSGVFANVRSNVTYQVEMLRDDLAILAIDFVDDDALYPPESTTNPLRKDGINLVVLTPVVDALTGQHCILLRRVLVHRYNLLSNSSRLHSEVNSLVPYLNGDLTMAMLCEALAKTRTNNHQHE